MTRWLRAARFVCGDAATGRVIEPLLADWLREMEQSESRSARVLAAFSGALAFARAVMICAVIDGVWIPPLRGTFLSLIAFLFALAVSVAVLMIPALPYDLPRNLAEPMEQRLVLAMLPVLLPTAFLLAMYFLRRDPRVTTRHAVFGITVIAVVATSFVSQTTLAAIEHRYNTFEFQERLRERLLDRERAGHSVFKGLSYERTMSTTLEQRRANWARFQAQAAEWRKADPPPTWSERYAQVQPIFLSVVFAVMGWILSGLASPTTARGLTWWGLVFCATITMDRLLSRLVGVPMPVPPRWIVLPLFAAITTVLAWHARQRLAGATQ